MNSSGNKKDRSESDESYRNNSKNSEILFGLDLSKEKEENISPLREKFELKGAESSPHRAHGAGIFVSPIYEQKGKEKISDIISPIDSINCSGIVNKFSLDEGILRDRKIEDNQENNKIFPRQKLNFSQSEENQKENLCPINKPSLIDKKFRCTCDKSRCKKKYCECYNNGEACDAEKCKCTNCENILTVPVEERTTPLYCNCTKSGCRKQYCECFKNKRECNKLCRCINCINNLSQKSKKKEGTHNMKQSLHKFTITGFSYTNISIHNSLISIESYTKNLKGHLLKHKTKRRMFTVSSKKIKKRIKNTNKSPILAKDKRTPLFTTTCETSSNKIPGIKIQVTDEPAIKKKLEIKKWENHFLFENN